MVLQKKKKKIKKGVESLPMRVRLGLRFRRQ
jgi:hypothetical protein